MTGLARWLARILLLLAATTLALVVGDRAAGWLLGTRERHLFRLPARAQARHQSTEFDYVFHANRLGFRGPDRPFARPPATRRIAVIGDSFVAGYGVADDAVFTARLERLLNGAPAAGNPPSGQHPSAAERSGPVKTEVINLGRNGTSTIRELDLYERFGRRWQPDVVVLAFFLGNDLVEVLQEHDAAELAAWHPRGAVRRVAYALCPNLYLELALMKLSAEAQRSGQPRTEAEVLAALRQACGEAGADVAAAEQAYRRLPPGVREALEQRRLRDHQILAACYDPGRLARAIDPDGADWNRAWPRVERHLDRLKAAVTGDGAELAMMIIPDAVQIDPAAHDFAASIGYRVEAHWLTGRGRTQEALAAWCQAHAVPCLDLTDRLREADGPLYYPQDGHWNAAGHDRAAAWLAEFLQSEVLSATGDPRS